MYSRNWDLYFLSLAQGAGTKSNCLSRHIGSVLTNNNIVIGTGYNGPPRGIPHCDEELAYFKVEVEDRPEMCEMFKAIGDCGACLCPRQLAGYGSGEGLEFCVAVHSERNALLAAAQAGTSTTGSTLHCFCGPPCQECMKEIIQAGVRRIVCLDDAWYDTMSEYLFKMSSMEMTQYSREEVSEWLER